MREVVAGKSNDSQQRQFTDEQRHMGHETDRMLPVEEAMAMKSTLSIPWNKFRQLRRYNAC